MTSSIFKACVVLLLPLMTNAAPLNHFQVLGSHNSYKQPLIPEVQQWLEQQSPENAAQISYSHLSIAQQLDSGLRQLEIDVVADPQGGHYAHPWAETFFKKSFLTQEQRQTLLLPGFKVLHIPGLDINTHCITFKVCLQQLRQWSDTHPQHFPVMIMLNAKENQPDFMQQAPPVPFDEQQYALLDKVILATMGRQRLFTPDDLRAQHTSLNEAMLSIGWPELATITGKFIFLFDANNTQAELYRQNHPSLKTRIMFCSYPAGQDESAIIVANSPIEQQQTIRALVKQGYLVRTRADADFTASSSQKAAQFNAAIASGAQWISSDWYTDSPQQLNDTRGYHIDFSDLSSLIKPNVWVHPNPIVKQ